MKAPHQGIRVMVKVAARIVMFEQKKNAPSRGIVKADTSKVAAAKAKIDHAQALALAASTATTPTRRVSARGREVVAKMAAKIVTVEGARRSTRLPSTHMSGQRVSALGATVAEVAAARGLGSHESKPAPKPSKGAGEASRSYKMRPEWKKSAEAIEGDIGIIQRSKRPMPGAGSIGDVAKDAVAKAKRLKTQRADV